ncbi:hypothetical protein [Rhodococcus sp. AD45]|uniref:hypothetical protein n=1 Tax=Rhodococcus sp. (strain AD45) TaxID=103808 RepID=UPI0005D35F81|nr:hypothetical protein [Rhodococcus sp. AD45]KJF19398.1 hypothetical protein SZ00_06325 [Rhodococcus sp. AD45]
MNTIGLSIAATGTLFAATCILTGCGTVESPPPLTIAVTATSNEPAPSTAVITDLLVEHAKTSLLPDDGMVTIVTPDAITQVDLTPMRSNDKVEAGMSKVTEKIDDNLTTLEQTLVSVGSTRSGLDVIGVLDRALEATGAGGRVIVETSGFSTVAPLDLNAAGGWIANPNGFVEVTNPTDLPDATGKTITFLGLGYSNPASGQQTAGPAARNALTTIMTGLCRKMNAASCNTLPGPVSTNKPSSTTPVPIVELNQITTHCVGQVDIDTSIAFTPESAVLLPVVDDELASIADALANCPVGTTVNAVGHSAAVPHPSWGGGPGLEQQRAQAVLTRLHDLGAPTSALGAATAGGQIIDNMPGGNYREDLAIRNRTVTLTIAH